MNQYLSYTPGLGFRGVGLNDSFFDTIFSKAKDYAGNMFEETKNNVLGKVSADANNYVRETLGLPSGSSSGNTTNVPVIDNRPEPVKVQVPITTATSNNDEYNKVVAGIGSFTQELWNQLPDDQKATWREYAKKYGIKIPFDSVTAKGKTFLAQYKDVLFAAAATGITWYASKSLIGGVAAGAGAYIIAKNLVR